MAKLTPVFHAGAIAAALLLASAFAAADDVQAPAPVPRSLPYSFAPLIERSAPAVVNIYTHRIVHSRSATGVLNGEAFWRLFRDALLFGYGRDRPINFNDDVFYFQQGSAAEVLEYKKRTGF